MGSIKSVNEFYEGLDYDTMPEKIKNTRLREAVNIDLVGESKYGKLINIYGTTDVNTYIPAGYDAATLNVLGVFDVIGKYDYAGDGTYVDNPSVLIFKYDETRGSEIIMYDTVAESSKILYPNATDSTSLDFPPEGTVDAAFTKDRTNPQVYWNDFRNERRKLSLKWAASLVPPSINDLSVRKRYSGVSPVFIRTDDDGILTSGTYQILFRLYNTVNCNSADWSLPCNPIPIAPADCDGSDCDLGGKIGQSTSKSIVFSIEIPPDRVDLYDSFQLAIVKNTDGLPLPSDITDILEPNTEFYNAGEIKYTGIETVVATMQLAELLTEDASVRCAKTCEIKNNRLWEGNIKYFTFPADNGTPTYQSAKTIKREVNYRCPEDSANYKGHFREETYAYAIAYFDEFFNFGLVSPLDFTGMYKDEFTGPQLTVDSVTAIDSFYYHMILSSSPETFWETGDYVNINGNVFQFCKYIGSPTTTYLWKGVVANTVPVVGQTGYKMLGQQGNQSNGWAWKFPSRKDNQYTILNDDDISEAIGLRIEGLTNHPSWAKGFVIVRQDRIPNILYQTPHIPTVGVRGVPTQGIGPITYNTGDTKQITDSRADYKGELDHIAPKVFGMGLAKNVAVEQLNFIYGRTDNREQHFAAFYPYYQNHNYTFLNETPAPPSEGANPYNAEVGSEIPKYVLCAPPEYVFNKNGEPTFGIEISGNEVLKIVDAVALKRQVLCDPSPNISIANAYTAKTKGYYYWNRAGFVGIISMSNPGEDYFYDLPLFEAARGEIVANKQQLFVTASPKFSIDPFPFSSEMFRDLKIYGATEDLSNQQGLPNAVPGGTRSFFNPVQNQRMALVNTSRQVIDFTFYMWWLRNTVARNPFPYLPAYTNNIVDMWPLFNIVGDLEDPGVGNIDNSMVALPVNNIYADTNGNTIGGAWIMNMEKGLPDQRYSKNSTDWKYTGAYHIFGPAEVPIAGNPGLLMLKLNYNPTVSQYSNFNFQTPDGDNYSSQFSYGYATEALTAAAIVVKLNQKFTQFNIPLVATSNQDIISVQTTSNIETYNQNTTLFNIEDYTYASFGFAVDLFEVVSGFQTNGAIKYYSLDSGLVDSVAASAPIDIDVWGGDCFLTRYSVKINNNSQRISDIYANVDGQATDYDVPGTLRDPVEFNKNVKTGSFENNVEFLDLWIESRINTFYHNGADEYPCKTDDNINSYNGTYLMNYNGSYSIDNTEKVFVSKATDCSSNNGHYPARRIWSNLRLYQAERSAFLNTDGFDTFLVLSRSDLDEKFGAITKILDLGDGNLYTIQERKCRVDPVDRNMIQSVDGTNLTIQSGDVLGTGQYLPFDNGSQHIRTVKYYNGRCIFADAFNRQLLSFGAGGFEILSNKDVNTFFNTFIGVNIAERNLLGVVDASQGKQEYYLYRKDGISGGIVYSFKINAFKTIFQPATLLEGGVFCNGNLYLVAQNKLYTANTQESKRGFLFDSYAASSFKFVINDQPGIVKILNTLNLDMIGTLDITLDTVEAFIPGRGGSPDMNATLTAWNGGDNPLPIQVSNFQTWMNNIRNDLDGSKMLGSYIEVTFTIVNQARRIIEIASVGADMNPSYRNRRP